MSEQVLTISRSLFERLGAFNGVRFDAEIYFRELLFAREEIHFMDRDLAEKDPRFKQVIPYCLFKWKDMILSYERGKKGGEKRLHALRSIGIGGHINPVDGDAKRDLFSVYFNGVYRELSEELIIPGTVSAQMVGILNDDSNEVGKVHLGIIHLFQLNDSGVRSGEDGSLTDLCYYRPEALKVARADYETWSQLVIDSLPNLLT